MAAIVVRHAVAHLAGIGRRDGSLAARRARRLRLLLEDLGASAIKIGQILSTRPDVLGPEMIAELSRLQDAAAPEAPGVIESVIAAELGRPPEEVFSEFDSVPIAAASIGQAHAARLPDGTDVVVKVRRPGVLAQVDVDLDILERAASLLHRVSRAARRQDIHGLVAEFTSTLRAELDYEHEAANAERFAANFAGRRDVRIPRVFHDATTSRVITLSRLHGIKPDDIDGLRQAGIDLGALAHRCADMMLTMIFEHGFFHADPHAGNFFVEPDGTVGIVDFGMVGSLDDTTRHALVRALGALASGDAPRLADEAMRLGIATTTVDRAALLASLQDLVERHLNRPLAELRIGALLLDVLAVMRRHRLRLPANLAMLAKVFAMSEGLAARLDPSFQMAPVVLPYVSRLAAGNRGSRT